MKTPWKLNQSQPEISPRRPPQDPRALKLVPEVNQPTPRPLNAELGSEIHHVFAMKFATLFSLSTQRLQYPFIKEYTLNYNYSRIPNKI